LLLGVALLGLTAGCSGINAGKSISPLDFLLPGGGGLMRGLLYVPPPAAQDPTNKIALAPETPIQVAQAR